MQSKEPLERKPVNPIFIGFTIYDFVHLFCSTFLLISAYVHREGDWVLEASKASAEIAFSLLLMSFIISIVKNNEDRKTVQKAYGFAWLTACSGMALSSSFMIPYVLTEQSARAHLDLEITCFLLYVLFSLSAFTLVLIALFMSDDRKAKRVLFLIALGCLLAAIPLSIIGECNFGHSTVDLIMAILVDVAPLFLIVFGLHRVIKSFQKQ